ncbi:hypothetical protein [Dysgonomonas sp. HGC4]|uniref:hypothetical protein n=1 Tax=Dysgonomonas sp. HGC4 TaxID=1658009 RepID=UPI0006812020|nr:hypothetical protein [Dysgonomonas sp. HGC4]MBD8349355.1 hypothetical protein [Dysgonomonas sp. HGC4]
MANKIYFNPPQQQVMYTSAHTTVFVGGRRIGKTHGIASPFVLRNIQQMPRSSGAFVFPSYKRGLTNTLPGTLKGLEAFGFKRDLHYVLGKKPPKSLGFAKPIIEPANYEHVMYWYNGSIVYFISQDIIGSSNSLTLDWILCDEAKFLDFEKLKDETFPANGGIRSHFGHIPYHHGMLIISDMPTTKRGSWFLGYKDKMDLELIETIHGVIYELWKIEERFREAKRLNESVPKYLPSYYKTLAKTLSQLRKVAVNYGEWSSIENLLVLGEDYIKQMKRDLPPIVFQTSILCKRLGTLKDGFYAALNSRIHYYTRNNNDYLQGLDYNLKKVQDNSSLQDADVLPFEPICVAMDYNSNINWLVAGQREGRFINTIKSFYVKYERKLEEVINDFCHYYRFHLKKHVVYYYDSTALGSNYAVNDDSFAIVAERTFLLNGWEVTMAYIGQPMKHHEKHLLINRLLKGQVEGGLTPLLNQENNEELIVSIENTGTRNGPNGFSKDKSGEKLAETEEDKLEYRTDGTDAWDTLVIGMNRYPADSFSSGMGGSWTG